jgi:hypothetical protein
MDQDKAPAMKRRLDAHGRLLRRGRIFARQAAKARAEPQSIWIPA